MYRRSYMRAASISKPIEIEDRSIEEPSRSVSSSRTASPQATETPNEQATETPNEQATETPNEANSYTTEQILLEGLVCSGFSDERQQRVKADRNEDRFRGNYGVSSLAISKVVANLLDENSIKQFSLKYFFLTLHWLKAYPTYLQLEGPWKLSPETIAAKINTYVLALQSLKERKIKWFAEGELTDEDVFIISVDGVHCRVQEPRKDPGTKWYSHKSHKSALSYELGIAIRSDRLVWMNGPVPAGVSDITLYRVGGGDEENPGRNLMSMIPQGKRVIADSGYSGDTTNDTITVTRNKDSKGVKRLKARAKCRHETFNSRVKSFTILDIPFRHPIEMHQAVFESVCVLVQYDLESGHGLYEV